MATPRGDEMIHTKEFEKWLCKRFAVTSLMHTNRLIFEECWSACEQMYEQRRCDGCKHGENVKQTPFEKSLPEAISKTYTANKCHKQNINTLSVTESDFSCKYWEAKP